MYKLLNKEVIEQLDQEDQDTIYEYLKKYNALASLHTRAGNHFLSNAIPFSLANYHTMVAKYRGKIFTSLKTEEEIVEKVDKLEKTIKKRVRLHVESSGSTEEIVRQLYIRSLTSYNKDGTYQISGIQSRRSLGDIYNICYTNDKKTKLIDVLKELINPRCCSSFCFDIYKRVYHKGGLIYSDQYNSLADYPDEYGLTNKDYKTYIKEKEKENDNKNNNSNMANKPMVQTEEK